MKKMHMIGQAHIDPVWLWRWMEGYQEVKATFRSALDRMNEDEAFTFTASSSIFYEWVEESDPAMFAEIKARVDEGRWEITGGWLIEPDCNLPSGESFARQGLYGQRYFKEKFGKTARVGYNPDSFGHTWTLPQIFNQQGITEYVFMRPGDHEKITPRMFNWKSPDGAEVLCYRIPISYNTWKDDLREFADRLYPEMLEAKDERMLFYGVGNHGGGPTKANIACIHEMNGDGKDVDHVFSTTHGFFDAMRKNGIDFPVVCDDLQHHASGCYSVHSGIKHWNRKAEHMLGTAEIFSTIAKVVKGIVYPDDFTRAWKNVLFNQFHDILAGTSLITGYEDARDMYGEAASIATRNLNTAVQKLSWSIDSPMEDGMDFFPIVAFNPHPWGGKMVCEVEIRGVHECDFMLLDDEGNEVPVQLMQSETIVFMGRVVFVADLPAMGYRTYRIYRNRKSEAGFANVAATATTLENDWLKLAFNPETGNMTSLFDKTQKAEMLVREGARMAVIEDMSDTWSHDVFKFDKEIANMAPVYIRVVEEGPVRSTIRVRYQHNDSIATQDFSLYRELPYADVRVMVDWREPFSMMKIKFPVNLDSAAPTYEIPFGSITRVANGEEEAGQNWVDFAGVNKQTGKASGLALMNTAKYSYDFTADEMGMTVLRNAVYAHHDPWKLDPEKEYTTVEEGVQRFSYALLPHEGDWKDSTVIQTAQEINRRPTIVVETYHAGDLPQTQSFLQVDNAQVIVTAVKEAEDGDGVVIRAYNSKAEAADAVIDAAFMGKTIKAGFAPREIKTFKLPYNGGAAVEVNLLEW